MKLSYIGVNLTSVNNTRVYYYEDVSLLISIKALQNRNSYFSTEFIILFETVSNLSVLPVGTNRFENCLVLFMKTLRHGNSGDLVFSLHFWRTAASFFFWTNLARWRENFSAARARFRRWFNRSVRHYNMSKILWRTFGDFFRKTLFNSNFCVYHYKYHFCSFCHHVIQFWFIVF